MFNPSFRELEEKGGNRYTLVLLISKRARQLIAGDEPMVNTNSKRQVSIALEELFEDKISFSEHQDVDIPNTEEINTSEDESSDINEESLA